MRIIETKVFTFDELSDEAKRVALEEQAKFELSCEWYNCIYDEAEELGFNITGFDVDYYCDIELKLSAYEIAQNIIRNHGEHCDTYKTAESFIEEWNRLVKKYSDGINLEKVAEENEYDFDNEADEAEHDFKKALSKNYRILLRKEYEAVSDEEYLIEIIKINNYEFTENGKLI